MHSLDCQTVVFSRIISVHTSIQIIESCICVFNSCASAPLKAPIEKRNATARPCHHVKNMIDLNVKNLARGLIGANLLLVTAYNCTRQYKAQV